MLRQMEFYSPPIGVLKKTLALRGKMPSLSGPFL
jgi:hypothetical protein